MLFQFLRHSFIALLSLCCIATSGTVSAYDVEADSTNNSVYVLLRNLNPSASYDSVIVNSNVPGLVSSASASIVPASVAAGGSDIVALDFTVPVGATLGATGDLQITVSGTVSGQAVDVDVTVPLVVVSNAASAQGAVGTGIPAAYSGGIDTDGDGVSDALEIAFGSDPNSSATLPGDPFAEENVPMLGILGMLALGGLFVSLASPAVRRNTSMLVFAAVIFLPSGLIAGSSTRIQLVAEIPVPPPMPEMLFVVGATASNGVGEFGPDRAIDGNMGTRWGTDGVLGDPQWLVLDFGSPYAFAEVIINWEAANAATYEIQGSNDNSSWTTISSESGGTFGNRTDTVTLSGTYSYLRMYGLSRTSVYGYSIWEMQVYGLPASDEDGDGVDDSTDQCLGTPGGSAVAANGCPDTDNDGVNDGIDQCPGTFGGSSVDSTGCVVVDTDGDGVPDSSDLCANTPANTVVDGTGCIVVVPVNEVSSVNGILVGGTGSSQPGFALYVFDNDLAVPDTSTCVGSCATSWPPLLVSDGIATGVNDLGTIVRGDSTIQATYNGRPLYYYVGDTATGQTNGESAGGVWHTVAYVQLYTPLFDATTPLEPVTSYVRADGVVVTRFGDRGRDRHAKDIGYYGGTNWDHYDHYLAEYWHYRTARIQLEDHVPNGTSLIKATYITESRLGAKEFRVWFSGVTTTGQFHFNPTAVEVDSGTFDDDFNKISSSGIQYKYTLDITEQWKNVATFNEPLQVGVNMEFEISQFLVNPPSGTRLNYYGTSYVYVIGTPGVAPFEWERGVNNNLSVNDGTPIPSVGLLGGETTLGYNYSEEPAGRFMQMATNLSHVNAQPFVEGRRVHHTNFIDGSHDERNENPVWSAQVGKAGNHYINTSCANCHVRNGRALVADVGQSLDKWVFKVGDVNGDPDPAIGSVLQPNQTGSGAEGTVTLGAWTDLPSGLRSPNYIFSNGTPARFSARIAPQLVGIGLLEAVPESQILAWEDATDSNSDGISGRASQVLDPVSGVSRLGRFGYKASTSSVEHQVAAALNTDIGVMTSVLPSPDCGSSQTTCGSSGSELTDTELNKLVKYISLLGVGARRDYDVTEGEMLFDSAGCESCHRDTLTTSDYHPLNELRGQTIHPYTDLLLHDMGAGLADNHGEGSANGAEWRTAPLWGLGHAESVMLGDVKANDTVTQPIDPNNVNRIGYLHDGRARTIHEAIMWHGGEAATSQAAYDALSQTDKDALIAFLESL